VDWLAGSLSHSARIDRRRLAPAPLGTRALGTERTGCGRTKSGADHRRRPL